MVGEYYRCAVCKQIKRDYTVGGYIKVGMNIIAIVCPGECIGIAAEKVSAVFPDALPDIGADGFVTPIDKIW